MSDSETLFPNLFQPSAALKACAPMSVKFWENQETVLKDLKEFSDGWFERRQRATNAALEAAQHISNAESPSDVVREYQTWLTREMALLTEDGKACQRQVLKAGTHLKAQQEEQQQVVVGASARGEPGAGKRRTG
jgi:hypothetical protein